MVTVLVLSLQFSVVQTYVAQRVASYLSKELDAEISLRAVHFRPFSSLTLHDFSINDQASNRMVYAQRLYANLNLTRIFNNRIEIRGLKLTDAYINYQSYRDSSNFKFLVDYFAPPKKTDGSKKPSIHFDVRRVEVVNSHFIYSDNTKKKRTEGVDFAYIELTEFSGLFDKIELDTPTRKLSINGLTFKEKSGLHLKKLVTNVSVGSTFMEFDQLELQTNRSLLRDYLKFDYDKFSDFGDFIRKVHITANIDGSFVDSKDIEFFAPTMQYVRFTTEIERAGILGMVSDIVARDVKLKTERATLLDGDFTVKGLPDINKTLFDFHAKQLSTDAEDVEKLVRQLANRQQFDLPEQLHRLRDIRFDGAFRGLYNDFEVKGDFVTALGHLWAETSIDIRNGLTYQGEASSTSFDIGELLQTKIVGKTGIDLTFSGKDLAFSQLQLQANGGFTNFYLENRSIEHISFQTEISNKNIFASGDVLDQNATLTYDATIDFSEASPIYALTSRIDHLHLSAFGLVSKDSVSIRQTDFTTNLIGSNINNLTGFLDAPRINLYAGSNSFAIEDLYFLATGDQHDRSLQLKSNVIDLEMTGVIDLNTIVPYFKSVAMRYAPAIGFEKEPFNTQHFDLGIHVKSFNPISAFLDRQLALSDGAKLSANFSSEDYLAKFAFFAPEVQYKNMRADHLAITENADQDKFVLDVVADRFYFTDSLYAEQVQIRNVLANDSLLFQINVASDSSENYLRLNGGIHFVHHAPAIIHFGESNIILAGEKWAVNTDSELKISKGRIFLENLVFSQNQQSVEINGVLSDQEDKVMLEFHRFGLASLEALTNPLGIRLRGEVNGSMEVNSVFKSPNFTANISTTPIIYNDLPIGRLTLDANYRPDMNIMDVSINLSDELNRGLNLEGTINLSNKQDMLKLSGEVKQVDLVIFQPFLRTLVKDMTGRMSGNLTIAGTLNTPAITGKANFHQAAFTVIYLNTTYSLHEQTALIDDNVVRFQNLKLNDRNSQQAVANGFLDMNRLSDPLIDVSASAQNFLVLNTTYRENSLYYGTAYASGTFTFKGRTSGINIDINASSNPNTIIHIPFNAAMTVSESDFIYFVEKDSESQRQDENRLFFRGLTMNMNLRITPDAEINLQTDIGALKGVGTGEIQLRISSLGDFEMFGDYVVNSGKFHFTAQDFINKYFDIKEGGTVRWTGNPAEATINLTAIYQQRTAVGALYNSAGRPGQDERVLAQADMIISGTLSQPDISFDLNFPLNPYIKDELQAYLSDANNVNQQALSLIVRRSFTASTTSEFGREVNSTLLSAGTEIAFNQLNTIISQSLNINFLDLNIRSFNDASASLRLFDDRLVLTGGISDQRNLRNTDLTFFSNQVVTDAELTYRIRRDGNLMFRAYNRLNTRNILFTPTDDYINAAGLVYRQEFNTFQEFFRRMMNFRRQERPVVESSVPESSAN